MAKKTGQAAKPKTGKKIKIVKPIAGIYGLSDNIGDIISLNQKQMETMVESGHAEWVE